MIIADFLIIVFLFFFLCVCFCWQINYFTTEAGLFVRHLEAFSKIDNIHINQQIADLLRQAVCHIEELFRKVDIIESPERSIVNLIFHFDEQQYSLRRFLECQSCNVSASNSVPSEFLKIFFVSLYA